MQPFVRRSATGKVFSLDFLYANALFTAASYQINTGWGRLLEVEL